MKLLPDGKSVIFRDDLHSLKMSKHLKVLFLYNGKVSGNKADITLSFVPMQSL